MAPKTHNERGARLRPQGSWKGFVDQVEEAAAKRAKAPKSAVTPVKLANLQRGPYSRLQAAPRCTAARRAGGPCPQPAVRGSKLCTHHGGLLDVPEHPANAKRLDRLRNLRAAYEARDAFYAMPAPIRLATRQALKEAEGAQRRRRGYWQIALAGAQALQADDTGKAFRRWLETLKPQKTCDNVTQ